MRKLEVRLYRAVGPRDQEGGKGARLLQRERVLEGSSQSNGSRRTTRSNHRVQAARTLPARPWPASALRVHRQLGQGTAYVHAGALQEAKAQARARAKYRHNRLVKSAGCAMVGDSQAAILNLVERAEI